MQTAPSAMATETREAADVVARLLDRQGAAIEALGRRLRERAPPIVTTCARGSSDHAASFLKYAVEIATGIPVASIGPSVASVYGTQLKLSHGVTVSISQSGRSPDIVALQENARRGGALTVALVNVEDSPLAAGADVVVPLGAGTETSVAATKSFVASVAAAAAIVAAWTGDEGLTLALHRLPQALAKAAEADWSPAADALAKAGSLFVVGRGPAFAIAKEAALKGKETAGIHAEAFSIAELMHGPLQIVGPGFPVLAFVPDDAAAPSTRELLARLTGFSGHVFGAGVETPARPLPFTVTGHGLTDAITMAVSFYRMIEGVARARGFDPDRPAKLNKVTETV